MDRTELRDAGIAGALGAAIGGILAISFGFPWWPLGVIAGALTGFFSYRPREVVSMIRLCATEAFTACHNYLATPDRLWQTIKESGKAFACGIIWGELIVGLLIVWVGSFSTIGALVILSGLSRDCTGWLMAFPIVGMIFVMPISGMFTFILSGAAQDIHKNNEDGWLLVKKLQFGKKWHIATILKRDESATYACKCAFILITAPWLMVIFIALFILDLVMTAWMHLATTPRLAAMEGAAGGSVVTYLWFVHHGSSAVPAAIIMGIGTGALLSIGIYALRCWTFNANTAPA